VSARTRFFFVHIQKTGGTTLWHRLARQFEPAAMYPDATDGDLLAVAPQISVTQLLARWEQRRDEIEIVTGHFPMATAELLHEDFTTLTILREPVDRVLSQLHRYREREPAAGGRSLEQLYESNTKSLAAPNHMAKMFALTADEIASSTAPKGWAMFTPIELTPERMTDAKERLTRVDALGLQDRFEEFCDELQARFGWNLGTPGHANRSQRVDEVGDGLRARIAADNALDIEFFAFARDLYESRPRAGQLDKDRDGT
jgi:hypothetical protein